MCLSCGLLLAESGTKRCVFKIDTSYFCVVEHFLFAALLVMITTTTTSASLVEEQKLQSIIAEKRDKTIRHLQHENEKMMLEIIDGLRRTCSNNSQRMATGIIIS